MDAGSVYPESVYLQCVKNHITILTEASLSYALYSKPEPRRLEYFKQNAATRFYTFLHSTAMREELKDRERGKKRWSTERRYDRISELAGEHQQSHVFVKRCELVIQPFGRASFIDEPKYLGPMTSKYLQPPPLGLASSARPRSRASSSGSEGSNRTEKPPIHPRWAESAESGGEDAQSAARATSRRDTDDVSHLYPHLRET